MIMPNLENPIEEGHRTPVRLAIAVSHPIQHFVSFYRAIAASPLVDLHVVFGSRQGLKAYFDAEMNTVLSWNMDLLSGYQHVFLPRADEKAHAVTRLNDPGLGPALDRIRPDVVMIYGYRHMNSLRALHWCRRNKIPAIMIGDSEARQRRAAWKDAVKRMALPIFFRQFRAFLSVGDENEAYYQSYGVPRDRIFRSPFTIDEESFRAAQSTRDAARARIRAAHALPEDAFIALFVGKLSERKRAADLLNAVKRLGNESRVHALFAGSGPLLEDLKADAAGCANGHFLGFINVDELPNLFAAADALVQCSSADPHPLVCSEAAISGLPMILSDRVGAAGPTDVARPGENALIYPCGDVDALAERLRRLSSDRELHRAMSAASSRIFSEVDVRSSVQGLLRAVAAVTGRIDEEDIVAAAAEVRAAQTTADEAA
jgi:glycosyltransferase involved in cell wall biosynthesis